MPSPPSRDAMLRIRRAIRANGSATNASIFFTIFQTFMCGEDGAFILASIPATF